MRIKVPKNELVIFEGIFGYRAAHALAILANDDWDKNVDLFDLKVMILEKVYQNGFRTQKPLPKSLKTTKS